MDKQLCIAMHIRTYFTCSLQPDAKIQRRRFWYWLSTKWSVSTANAAIVRTGDSTFYRDACRLQFFKQHEQVHHADQG
jgi:hypothetical protein